MVNAQAQFLYSPNHCKILHMVRHAQGIHNVEAEKNVDALLSDDLFDCSISQLGWQQVGNLRNYVHASGLLNRIDLVVTSPLLRTMQTAAGVFGIESHLSVADKSSMSMMENLAIPAFHCPPIVAHELCRDRLGLRPCDKRRSVSECQSLFPEIDFSLMESEEDDLWYPEGVREPYEKIVARGIEFMKWLWSRPEREIAIVSHGVVLQHLLYVLENDTQDPSVKKDLCQRFNNCELRSVVIVNKGMMEMEMELE